MTQVSDASLDALRAQLEKLSPAKRAFVEQRLREAHARAQASGQAQSATIVHRAPGESALLSTAQEVLWRLEQVAPGTSTYHVPRVLRVRGPLDVERLRVALDALVARHAALRTTILVQDGEPRQMVQPPRPVEFRVVDVRAAASAQRASEMERILRDAVSAPFDLSADQLLRATLIHTDTDEWVLLLLSHHIASDGASGGILLRDLAALYGDPHAALPPLAIEYADFAVWQRGQLTQPRVQEHLAYWREQLAGVPSQLELPTDRPRPVARSFNGARCETTLPLEIADAVRATAIAHRTTPFVVLLSAFHALLHRYARQDDIVIGTVITGRERPELEGIVGYFSNTVPVRASFTPDLSFSILIERVRDASLGASEHAEIPYETLALEVRRHGGPSSLFDVMFAMNDEAGVFPKLGEASLSPVTLDRGIAKFDLMLGAGLVSDGLRVVLEYRTDLFDAPTVERMLDHYGVLLQGATAHPETLVTRLPVLSPQEYTQVVESWNRTAVAYPAEATLVSLMAQQAQRTPNAIAAAMASPGRSAVAQLTYAELDARATVLARALRSHGVTAGTLVGVCMERSLELVVALVGILKAGGAYVPLDPEYPADRLAFMAEDAGFSVVLAQSHVTPPPSSATILQLDTEWESIEQRAVQYTDALVLPTADDVAYMIYTSGSTGRPKGTLNRHRGIVNRLLWMQDEYRLTGADVVLQKTPFSFDVSVWEFFWPLITGARLVFAEPGGHRDPAYLADTIVQDQVTVLHFVPSMLRTFLEEPSVQQCISLRDAMCSGEALPYDLQQRFFAQIPNANLHNLYGPTECAVDVSYWQCRRDDPRHMVPIGRPVANTQLYVLDEAMQPVPIGVPGELYIGGVQVGAGYWGRPELTRERFVADPFAKHPALGIDPARLYKTGDLARWLPDGVIEYLGRLDFQVKLRGFRIELGEIEAALSTHPDVRSAVVLARDDLQGGPALVAYYATRSGQPISAATLRAHVRATLPDYMVPAAFVALGELPLTPSGKIDRKALPIPEGLEAAGVAYVAPRTETERRIADIWGEILNMDRVGVHDNFFDIGGHSLLAMRVAGRIHATFGVRIPFKLLFERPTVEALATVIDTADLNAAATPLDTPIVPQPRGDATFPVTAMQKMLWLHEQMAPGQGSYHIRLAFDVRGPLHEATLRQAFDMLVARHESLRTGFVEIDGEPVQRIAPSASPDFTVVDLTHLPEAKQETHTRRMLRDSAAAPFELTDDSLLRVTLVRRSAEHASLLIVAHHLVFDGWSAGIFMRELAECYAAARAERAPQLPPLPIQFADYAQWEQRSLDNEARETLLQHWRSRLHGAPSHIALSNASDVKADSPQRQSQEAGRRVVVLPEALTAALTHACHQHGATLFMGVLGAVQFLLSRLSGSTDIVVASPVAGRARPETSDLIGCFANTVALRGDLSGDPSFATVLQRTREVCLDAYAHEQLPFEELVGELRRTSNNTPPAFQVMVVQQDDAATTFTWGDVVLTPMELDPAPATFELKLSLTRTDSGLRIATDFQPDRVAPQTVDDLLVSLETILTGAVASPESPLGELGDTKAHNIAIAASTPTPGVTVTTDAGAIVPPQTAAERVITGVWREVLSRGAEIGVETNFFDLGGHSLLATKIVARVSALFRVRVPVRRFFEHPTIRTFVAALVRDEPKPGHIEAIAAALLRLEAMSPEERQQRRAASEALKSAQAAPRNVTQEIS